MSIIGFDVEVEVEVGPWSHGLTYGTPEWINRDREEMGMKTFEKVGYINKAFPVKQGVSSGSSIFRKRP